MDNPLVQEPARVEHSDSPAAMCSNTPEGALASGPEVDTGINELQDVFGTILLTDKKTHPVNDYSNWTLWSWTQTSYVPPPFLPKWTDTFNLLSFPREIRDTIYYHHLYHYKGIRYRRGTSNNILPLFLTCRQVYDEALQVFCRYNQIEIPIQTNWRHRDYGRAPAGMLRLFPDKARSLVQRIRTQYSQEGVWPILYDGTITRQKAGEVFLQGLRDAHTFKATFPMLRDFTASWSTYGDFFKFEELLDLEENDEEGNVQVWLHWMRYWIGKSNVLPPRGVKFQFAEGWQQAPMQRHASSMNEAYGRLLKETSLSAKEGVDLEDSGKKWIEEMSKGNRKKKRSSR